MHAFESYTGKLYSLAETRYHIPGQAQVAATPSG